MSDPAEPKEIAGNHASTRTALRREKIAAREALTAIEHRQRSAALEAHLADLLQHCSPRILGFCWPFRAEFDCRPLVRQLIAAGVRACLPLVKTSGTAMDFREWRPDSNMATDRHGIHFPTSGAMLIPDMLLIPVNAFDGSGYRLGYGSGYFDRTLASLVPAPLSIGVGFELARVASIDPQAHDIPLDAVVTESGLERFSDRLGVRRA